MSAARKEEACLVIRFVNEEGQVEEDFLGFFEATDTTGEGLTNLLIDSLTQAGLSLENCRGQSYDGASCMSGLVRGVQARVCKIQPCGVHTLRVALAQLGGGGCRKGAHDAWHVWHIEGRVILPPRLCQTRGQVWRTRR